MSPNSWNKRKVCGVKAIWHRQYCANGMGRIAENYCLNFETTESGKLVATGTRNGQKIRLLRKVQFELPVCIIYA